MVNDSTREQDEDHDLLTFEESGIRLNEEIEAVRASLAAAAGSEAVSLQKRLDALLVALERNTQHAGDKPGEAGFLNYQPDAR